MKNNADLSSNSDNANLGSPNSSNAQMQRPTTRNLRQLQEYFNLNFAEEEAISSVPSPTRLENQIGELRSLRQKSMKYVEQLKNIHTVSKGRERDISALSERLQSEERKMKCQLGTLDRLSQKLNLRRTHLTEEENYLRELEKQNAERVLSLKEKEASLECKSLRLDSQGLALQSRQVALERAKTKLEKSSRILFKADLINMSFWEFKSRIDKLQSKLEKKFYKYKLLESEVGKSRSNESSEDEEYETSPSSYLIKNMNKIKKSSFSSFVNEKIKTSQSTKKNNLAQERMAFDQEDLDIKNDPSSLFEFTSGSTDKVSHLLTSLGFTDEEVSLFQETDGEEYDHIEEENEDENEEDMPMHETTQTQDCHQTESREFEPNLEHENYHPNFVSPPKITLDFNIDPNYPNEEIPQMTNSSNGLRGKEMHELVEDKMNMPNFSFPSLPSHDSDLDETLRVDQVKLDAEIQEIISRGMKENNILITDIILIEQGKQILSNSEEGTFSNPRGCYIEEIVDEDRTSNEEAIIEESSITDMEFDWEKEDFKTVSDNLPEDNSARSFPQNSECEFLHEATNNTDFQSIFQNHMKSDRSSVTILKPLIKKPPFLWESKKSQSAPPDKMGNEEENQSNVDKSGEINKEIKKDEIKRSEIKRTEPFTKTEKVSQEKVQNSNGQNIVEYEKMIKASKRNYKDFLKPKASEDHKRPNMTKEAINKAPLEKPQLQPSTDKSPMKTPHDKSSLKSPFDKSDDKSPMNRSSLINSPGGRSQPSANNNPTQPYNSDNSSPKLSIEPDKILSGNFGKTQAEILKEEQEKEDNLKAAVLAYFEGSRLGSYKYKEKVMKSLEISRIMNICVNHEEPNEEPSGEIKTENVNLTNSKTPMQEESKETVDVLMGTPIRTRPPKPETNPNEKLNTTLNPKPSKIDEKHEEDSSRAVWANSIAIGFLGGKKSRVSSIPLSTPSSSGKKPASNSNSMNKINNNNKESNSANNKDNNRINENKNEKHENNLKDKNHNSQNDKNHNSQNDKNANDAASKFSKFLYQKIAGNLEHESNLFHKYFNSFFSKDQHSMKENILKSDENFEKLKDLIKNQIEEQPNRIQIQTFRAPSFGRKSRKEKPDKEKDKSHSFSESSLSSEDDHLEQSKSIIQLNLNNIALAVNPDSNIRLLKEKTSQEGTDDKEDDDDDILKLPPKPKSSDESKFKMKISKSIVKKPMCRDPSMINTEQPNRVKFNFSSFISPPINITRENVQEFQSVNYTRSKEALGGSPTGEKMSLGGKAKPMSNVTSNNLNKVRPNKSNNLRPKESVRTTKLSLSTRNTTSSAQRSYSQQEKRADEKDEEGLSGLNKLIRMTLTKLIISEDEKDASDKTPGPMNFNLGKSHKKN